VSRDALATIEARLSAGDAAGARAVADALLAGVAIPLADRVMALKLRARAHEALSNPRAAIVDLEGVLALTPTDARACNDLGIACADAGETAHAIDAFRRATTLDPGFARGWNNYGNALRGAGRVQAAADAFAHAVAADPGYALAWANLGAVQRELGEDAHAEVALSRALALNPAQRAAAYTLAGLRRDQGRIDAAVELYERAAQLDPRDANAAFFLGSTLAERDDLAGAALAFERALARDPRLLRAAIARRLTLPMVPEGAAAIERLRARYAQGLEVLAGELPGRADSLTADRAVDELRWTNFLLAYHGEDDRELQRGYAEIARAVVDRRAGAWLVTPARRARGARIRVGFASAFFRDGTAGRYFQSWITDLPRERFEIFVYHLQPSVDALAQRLAARADTFRHCPRWRPSQLAPRIRGDVLDVLVYPELGMDATSFALAGLKLAPRQCVAWGHPVTTGLPTIDAFFTCAAMEPEGSDAHYTESLVRLPGIGTRYAVPPAPAAAERTAFGLPEGVPLFFCPQSAFKIHPDDDALLARVLAATPAARLVLFEARHPLLTAKLRARLSSACAAAGIDDARVHMLPQCDHDDYLRVSASCDVMLDTSRWSGGNTALDALACGLPIVTLPGRFMRARQSAAMLRQGGIDDLIARDAEDYVRIAAQLASDRERRDSVAGRIRAGRTAIFDDAAPIAALADALERIADT
jgi:predicted O-linked N-acetylglucosamine transferase (SPINDLY family)